MNAEISSSGVPEIQAQAHDLDRRQKEELWSVSHSFKSLPESRGDDSPARVAAEICEQPVIRERRNIDFQAQVHDLTKRQTEQWFDWMDRILEIHRSNFVFREPTSAQLEEHKTALRLAIDYCNSINALIDDPGFNEPDLVSRLQVRVRQLQAAYDTFHDTTFSAAQAEDLLNRVFPE